MHHLEHVLSNNAIFLGINHILMLHLNTYRQAIYSWLPMRNTLASLKECVCARVSRFIANSHFLLTAHSHSSLYCSLYTF